MYIISGINLYQLFLCLLPREEFTTFTCYSFATEKEILKKIHWVLLSPNHDQEDKIITVRLREFVNVNDEDEYSEWTLRKKVSPWITLNENQQQKVMRKLTDKHKDFLKQRNPMEIKFMREKKIRTCEGNLTCKY